MAPRDDGVPKGRRDVATTKLHSLVHHNHRQPLSPIWEHYIHSIWQPEMQSSLDEYDSYHAHARSPSSLPPLPQEHIQALKRSITLHPFNMSCQAVNEERAVDFIYALEELRATVRAKEFAGRAWWPQSTEKLIKAIEAELECKERGGSREEQIEAAARMSGSCFNTVRLHKAGQDRMGGQGGTGEAVRKREGSSASSNKGEEEGKRRRLG